MTDKSKMINLDGNTLHQIGFETPVPNDGKVYGLSRGTKGKMSAKLVNVSNASESTDNEN